MGNQGKVLVLYLNRLGAARRVQRQVEFLASQYDVVVAAFDCHGNLPTAKCVQLAPDQLSGMGHAVESAIRVVLRLGGLYEKAYWFDARTRRWRRDLQRVPAVRAVVVNDLVGLPLGFAVAAGAPVVFDAHEHWTSESASWSRRQRLSMHGAHEWIVDRYVPKVRGLMTVSSGIARDYRERIGLTPYLVTNAPPFMPLRPSPVVHPISLLHVGVADERRRLEDMIDAVRPLQSRFRFDLVLAGNDAYRDRLARYASPDPHIRVLPPIPAADLVAFSNDYDVGVYLLAGDFPNFVHVLPNKLFDYIQARLAVAIGPSPEMVTVVKQWDCGVVSPSFERDAFTRTLNALTADRVERMKQNSDRAAQVLTAENNRDTVIDVVSRAIGDPETTTVGGAKCDA